jgi:lysophospholipase L1-like esterase
MNRIRLLLAFVFLSALALTSLAQLERPFGDNVVLRGHLGNSKEVFERTKKGHVAFLGGSITEMDGYRPMVMANLKKRFPETEFTFTAAGIASTCSTTGAFRLQSDVLSKGPVDLLFVEFAVNDDQDAAHTREECIRGMEGIVRHVRTHNPKADIVMTFFVNEPMLETFAKGTTPLTVEAHTAVAEHYAVPTINLARELAQQIAAGKITWKEYGGVHPAPRGNAICASMIDELFSRAWSRPTPPTPHAMPELLDSKSYVKGRFVDPAQAKIVSGWTVGVPAWAAIPGSKRERFTAIPMLAAAEPGAEFEIAFEGSVLGAYVVAGPDAGMVEVSVDGTPPTKVDLFHRYSSGLHYPRTVLLASNLPEGAHTARVKVLSETRSKGTAVRIMQFAMN